jgi:hypothetical protein
LILGYCRHRVRCVSEKCGALERDLVPHIPNSQGNTVSANFGRSLDIRAVCGQSPTSAFVSRRLRAW